MATGIVSVDLSLDGEETLSRVLLVLAVASWVGLGIVVMIRAALDAMCVRQEARSPAALTSVAATAVLGTRFSMLGWRWAALALCAVSLAVWLALLGPLLRDRTAPVAGVAFMPTVSTEAIAALVAALAVRERVAWWADAALALFVIGLLWYAVVLARFDVRELLVGRGDHWVSGGALAISALAAGEITLAARTLGAFARLPDALVLAVWIAALLWLPALIAAELIRPRLRYDITRWATVFPLGMYAACSFVVGKLLHAGAPTHFARIGTWAAFAVWLVVLAGLLRRVPAPSDRAGRGARGRAGSPSR